MSGDEEIVGADHLAAFLQISTNLRVVSGCVVVELQDRDVRKKRLKRGGVPRSVRRHCNSVEQLRLVITEMQTSVTDTPRNRLMTAS